MAPSLHRLHLTQPVPHAFAMWEWGNPSAKKTLLCVHGLTRNGRDFDVLAEALSADYRILAPDIPGRGESEPLPDRALYSNPLYLQDLIIALDALHIGKIDWVGTSMGGILGMMFAATQAERVGKLVLNDIGSLIPAAGLKRISAYAGQTEFKTRTEAEAELRARCAPYAIPSETHWQHLFTHSIRQTPQGFALAYDPAVSGGLIPADIQDMDLSGLWNAVHCPTLILRGAQSDILLAETARAMAASRPGVEYKEFQGAGHAPGLMREEEIAAVKTFLNG